MGLQEPPNERRPARGRLHYPSSTSGQLRLARHLRQVGGIGGDPPRDVHSAPHRQRLRLGMITDDAELEAAQKAQTVLNHAEPIDAEQRSGRLPDAQGRPTRREGGGA
jgi:hypothetical protein